jgi:chaperonin GroEL
MVLELAKKARDKKQSLLLIAPEYDSEVHVFLNQNKSQLQSCAIYSPNRGVYRQLMLDDLREIFKDGKPIKKVIVTNKTTTFVDEFKVSDNTIKTIKDFLYNPQLPTLDRQFHEKRLANFTGKLATISVGGFSKLEMRERFDRIEDAVCAVRAAREEGIVLGGGLTLANLDAADTGKIEFDFGDQASDLELTDDFLSVLKYPAELLGTINENKSTLAAAGVYEPFLVVKTVLENAISTAALVLTTDVAILNFNNFLMN